jgi:hypothetical protein
MSVCSRLLWSAAFALAVMACGRATYSHTEITAVTSPTNQVGGSISNTHVTVPVGMLVVAHIAPLNTDNNPMVASARTQNSNVVDVAPTTGDRDFAFLGVHVGSATVTVGADNDEVETLVVDVTPQE